MASGHLAIAAWLSAIALIGCSADDGGIVDDSASDSPSSFSAATGSLPEPTASETSPALPSDLVFQSDSIMIQPADGTGTRALTASNGPADQEHPDWSPDGASVVFDAGFSTLWTVRSDGDDLEQVYSCLDPCYVIQDPAWSPDGRSIAFRKPDDY